MYISTPRGHKYSTGSDTGLRIRIQGKREKKQQS